jgi:hypothetical protein
MRPYFSLSLLVACLTAGLTHAQDTRPALARADEVIE